MKTLLLLRHAASGWSDADRDDHDRSLNRCGESEVMQLRAYLEATSLSPCRILCSTARRAKTTCERVFEKAESDGTVRYLDALYLATPGATVQIIHAEAGDAERLLVLGHNPGLEMTVAWLTGGLLPMPTAALVHVEVDISAWTELSLDRGARIVAQWRPEASGA